MQEKTTKYKENSSAKGTNGSSVAVLYQTSIKLYIEIS